MLNPIPLHRRLPAHLAPPPARPPETDEDRRHRQLGLTRELTDLNMLAARDAAHRIVTAAQADPDPAAEPDRPASADPTLALARATRAVTLVMMHENRIAAGHQAAPFTAEDPRGIALRQLLHPLIAHEPDPARRRAIRTRVNERIDDAMAADLDDDLSLAQIAQVIANENGLRLDLTKIPDFYLDSPAARPAATAHPKPSGPAPRFTPTFCPDPRPDPDPDPDRS